MSALGNIFMHKIVVYHKSRRGSTKPLIFLHSAVTAEVVFRFLEQQMLSIPSLFSCINFICSEYLFGICSVERILKRKSNFWRWCIFIPSAAQQNFTAGVSDYCTSSAVNLELEIVVFLRLIIWKQCRRKQSEVKWEAFHIPHLAEAWYCATAGHCRSRLRFVICSHC